LKCNVDDILSGRSEIRNRIISRFFKEINFIEQWGTGIGKKKEFYYLYRKEEENG